MSRRKSRQSTLAPTNIDVEYSGDSSKFHHLLHKRVGQTGSPNRSQINFEVNLRSYKKGTNFVAERPFMVPGPKRFENSEIYKNEQEFLNTSISFFKDKYNDTY